MAAALGHCRDHPSVRAVDVCCRCGGFACLECVRSVRATVYCRSCVGHVAVPPPDRPSWRAQLALGLGLAAWLVPPLGLAGATLALVELARIRREESPVRGRAHARGALVSAGVALLLWVWLFVWASRNY